MCHIAVQSDGWKWVRFVKKDFFRCIDPVVISGAKAAWELLRVEGKSVGWPAEADFY